MLYWIQQPGASCDVASPINCSSPLAKGHARPNGSTVVHRWTGMRTVTKELKAGGTDDVCEWWLISTLADLLIHNAGPQGNV